MHSLIIIAINKAKKSVLKKLKNQFGALFSSDFRFFFYGENYFYILRKPKERTWLITGTFLTKQDMFIKKKRKEKKT